MKVKFSFYVTQLLPLSQLLSIAGSRHSVTSSSGLFKPRNSRSSEAELARSECYNKVRRIFRL